MNNHSERKEQLLIQLARELNYERMPPTVDEILDNEYYLGSSIGKTLFPAWRRRLKEIYPDPIRTNYTFIVPSGAIGIGKSYFSILVMLIDLIKLCHMRSPQDYFKVAKSTKLCFRFTHMNNEKAQQIFLDPIKEYLQTSPYFQTVFKYNDGKLPHNIDLGLAPKPGNLLGELLLGFVFSEVNFVTNIDTAKKFINNAIVRMTSRLKGSGMGLFPHIILDSSDTEIDSPVQEFLANPAFKDDTKNFTMSQWEARKHEGKFWNMTPKSFKVYSGDSLNNPFILNEGEESQLSSLDQDRFITVPSEFRNMFEADIIKSLNDLAGVSVLSGSIFFTNKDKISDAMSLEKSYPDIINDLPFYGDEQLLHRCIKEIEAIPRERKLYGRVDLALSQDLCGICLCYVDYIREVNGKTDLYIKVPVAFSLGRLPGEETSIEKIVQFFIDVNNIRELKLVTTDQFQSSAIRQQLDLAGINTELKSVDRNSSSYNILKNFIYDGRIELPKNNYLANELSNLINVRGNKVDHPKNGSKDCADALAGAVDSAFSDGLSSTDLSSSVRLESYSSLLDGLLQKNNNYKQVHRKWGRVN